MSCFSWKYQRRLFFLTIIPPPSPQKIVITLLLHAMVRKDRAKMNASFFPYLQDCSTSFIPLETRKNPSTPTKASMTEPAPLQKLSYMTSSTSLCSWLGGDVPLLIRKKNKKICIFVHNMQKYFTVFPWKSKSYPLSDKIESVTTWVVWKFNEIPYWYMYTANQSRCMKSRASMLKGLLKHVVSRECVKKPMNIQSSFLLFVNFIHACDRGLLFLLLQFLPYPPHHSLQTSCVLFVFSHHDFT